MATIIIQEYDTAVLDVLTLALESEGHATIPFSGQCPNALIETVKQNSPHLVLMDYRSRSDVAPMMLCAIRKASHALPVIALSYEFGCSKLAMTCGFSGFLQKPFDLDELFNIVDEYTAGHSSSLPIQ